MNQRLIAKELKLSQATVSKSLSNHPDIRPETRAMVLDVAARLGYRISLGSRTPGRKKQAPSRFVGVLFHDDHDARGTQQDAAGRGYLTGLSEAAVLRNVNLIVHRFGPDERQLLDPRHQPAALRDGLLQGLILVHRIDPQCVLELSDRLPTVLITHAVPGARADLIDSDHAGGIGKLVDHLFSLGHRRIGFVAARQNLSWSQARFGSYCQSLARLHLPLNLPDLIGVFQDEPDVDRRADNAVAAIRAGVTAFVCASDAVGYELCRRLLDRGLRIPQEVSLTGFDAMDPLYCCPPLTTLRVPFAEMGAAALARVLARLDRTPVYTRQTLLECTLMEGATTAPPKQ